MVFSDYFPFLGAMYDPRYETMLKRLGAAIVDTIVFMPLLLIGQWIYGSIKDPIILIAWFLFTIFGPIVYYVVLNYKYGWTIGKWVAGLKIVDVSETKTISLRQSIIRLSPHVAVVVAGLLYLLFLAQRGAGVDLNEYNGFVKAPFLVLGMTEFIFMLASPKKRALHDLLARSTVVRKDCWKDPELELDFDRQIKDLG